MNPFSLLDLLFPKRCVNCGKVGSYICHDCYRLIEFIDKPVCLVCQRQAVSGKTHPGCRTRYSLDGLVVAARYKGPVKKAIAKVKYRFVYDLAKTLTDLIIDNLWKFDLEKNLILVPIPLHVKRKKWRGFNQAELLAKILAKSFQVNYSDLLMRTVETKTQVGFTKDQRKKNVAGVFSLKSNANIAGKDIALVDDVYTSGATMSEAAKILKKAKAKSVWAMAVALG